MKKSLYALFALGLFAAPAPAQDWGHSFSPGEAREAVRDGRSLPLAQILAPLKEEHGGYLLSADLFSTPSGAAQYHIQWMTGDGRKTVFIVDAQTGTVLERRGA